MLDVIIFPPPQRILLAWPIDKYKPPERSD
jgi:hypothetical protein